MKKIVFSLFVICALTSSAFAMTFNQAQKEDKPVVVMFHMHGCGACKKFSPIFDNFASKFSTKFNFVKEDVDNSSIAKSLNFQTVPALYIIKPKTMDAKRIDDDCAWDNACLTKTLQNY